MKVANHKKRLLGSMAGALLVLASGATAQAHDGPKREGFNEPFVLSGLKTMKAYVGKLDTYATTNGESEEHIHKLLTEGLDPCHINIIDESATKSGAKSDNCAPSDTPVLYLKLKFIQDEGGSKGAAYSVNLSLVEKAKINRNKKDLMVSVWNKESVGRCNGNIKDTVDKAVDSVIKDFHRDYLLANSADSSRDIPAESHDKAASHKKIGH